jgi:Ca-activated chloride channel homolog
VVSKILAALAVIAGFFATTSAASPAAADAPPEAAADDSNKLLLLFDSSGSMKEPDPDGLTKIDAARKAFARLIPRLPVSGEVGMRVYGATVFDRSEPGACRDSQLVVPVGRADKPALAKAVEGFEPYGETPISYALHESAKDLGERGQRTILLVSDGEETCDPDPCATARKIAGLGIDLKIDVVGFRIEAESRDQLRCIADAGSGTFYETKDADTLAASLERLSVRAFRPFRVSGTAVEGSTAAAGAPILEAGQYVDHAPPRGQTRHYRIRRSMRHSTLHVGVSARPAPGDAVAALHLQTQTVDGDTCGYGLGTEVSYARTNPVVTASASTWDQLTSFQSECQDADEVLVAVRQSDSSGATLDGVPVEIVVVEEPPIEGRDDLPSPADSRPRWSEPARSRPRPATAGASFSDAPQVGPGTHRCALFPGEVQFFKVRLEWGQRLEVAARAPRPEPKLAALTDNPQVLDVAAISPTRGKAVAKLSDIASRDQTFLRDDAEASAQATTVEVRYANRDTDQAAQRSVSLPGDYYVAVALGEDRDGQTYLLPVDIVIDVEGDAGNGAPRYVDDQALLVPGPGGDATEYQPRAAGEGSGTSGPDAGAQGSGSDSVLAPLTRGRTVAVVVLGGLVATLLTVSGTQAFRRRTARGRRGQ